MDVARYIKEIEQKTNKYDRREGSLQAVIDYSPECDIEAGPIEDKEEDYETPCLDACCTSLWWIGYALIMLALLSLGAYFVYSMVTSAIESYEEEARWSESKPQETWNNYNV